MVKDNFSDLLVVLIDLHMVLFQQLVGLGHLDKSLLHQHNLDIF